MVESGWSSGGWWRTAGTQRGSGSGSLDPGVADASCCGDWVATATRAAKAFMLFGKRVIKLETREGFSHPRTSFSLVVCGCDGGDSGSGSSSQNLAVIGSKSRKNKVVVC